MSRRRIPPGLRGRGRPPIDTPEAAFHGLRATWEAHHGGALRSAGEPNPAARGRMVRAVTAMLDRTRIAPACPHAEALAKGEPDDGRAVVAFLALGYAACRSCPPPPVIIARADGCDWCAELPPDGIYHPLMLAVGPLVVVGDVCPGCLATVGKLAGTGGAA